MDLDEIEDKRLSPAKDRMDTSPDNTPSNSRFTFFDLPAHIRTRIYLLSGLARPCTTRIDTSWPRNYPSRNNFCELEREDLRVSRQGGYYTAATTTRFCTHPNFPMALFRVSRQVHEEAARIFLKNRFAMLLAYRSDLDYFQVSLGWAFSRLRSLHIELRPGDGRFFKMRGGMHGTAWNTWAAFCRQVKEKMPALDVFSLKCKVRMPEVADKLFDHMQGFPGLLSCGIHFNPSPDDGLQVKVKQFCWKMTGRLDPLSFPFARLPKEMQLLVLEFLLTNRSDPYSPRAGNSLSEGFRCLESVVTFQNRRYLRAHDVRPMMCCGMCSPSQAMCFCFSRQCAFSTTCSCFSTPLPYFLVSREFYNMARHIFYSKNVFAFVEEDPEEMLRITHNIPTSTFMQIRRLAFKFPYHHRMPYRLNAQKIEETAFLSWSVLRRFIREHFDLPRLSISIIDVGGADTFSRTRMISSRNRYLRKLLLSFADLKGLRDFWVFLADDPGFEEEAKAVVLGRKEADDSRVYEEDTFLYREEL